MLDKYGDQSFAVVAVNLDESREDAERFLAASPAQFQVVYDPNGDLAREFGVEVMPSSYLLNADGEVIAVHRGFLSSKTDQYELSIRDHLFKAPGED